jgi:glutathione S-transferase
MSPLTIGYWSFKGASEYPKWVASYLNIPFVEKLYPDGGWFDEKFTLGLDFPNLPYIIDGNFKMCESKAIAYYFAAKANNAAILGEDLMGQTKVRQVIDVMCDIDKMLEGKIYTVDRGKQLQAFKEMSSPEAQSSVKIIQLNKYLGSRPFFVGDAPTLADLYVACIMRYYSILFRSSGNDCPFMRCENLHRHMKRVTELPGIAEWLARDDKFVIAGFFVAFPVLKE